MLQYGNITDKDPCKRELLCHCISYSTTLVSMIELAGSLPQICIQSQPMHQLVLGYRQLFGSMKQAVQSHHEWMFYNYSTFAIIGVINTSNQLSNFPKSWWTEAGKTGFHDWCVSPLLTTSKTLIFYMKTFNMLGNCHGNTNSREFTCKISYSIADSVIVMWKINYRKLVRDSNSSVKLLTF